jgi:hypothetical protein
MPGISRFSQVVRFFLRKPVPAIWHENLKTCPLAGFPGFGNRHAGNRENLAGEKETKTGMVPEQPLLVSGRYTCPVTHTRFHSGQK